MYFLKRKNKHLKSHLEIKGDNFFFLLISLLFFLFSWPFLSKSGIEVSYIFVFFIFLVLSSCIYAIGKKNKFALIIVSSFIFLIVVFRIIKHQYDTPLITFIWMLLNIICFLFIAIFILIHVLNDKKVTFNEIYGAICVYLLIGFVWGMIYALIARLNPEAFSIPAAAVHSTKEQSQYFYYSFITLTSVGYGDIFPISSEARLFAIIEGIFGQIYSVVLIGWLVGNLFQVRKT